MNQGPFIFLGAFAALTASWYGMVVQPQLQLGRAVPATNVVNTAELYPQARSGLAQQGLQVYRSLGCNTCHTQQVRQEGAVFDILLTKRGTNTDDLALSIQRVTGIPDHQIGPLISALPATLKSGVTDKLQADADAKAMEVGGAKVEVHMLAVGPDIERGWGRARTVASDFLLDRTVMPGSLRLGPDLANIGARQRSADWHYRHLYEPRFQEPKSVMPPYRFLFETRKVREGDGVPSDALDPSRKSVVDVVAGSRTNWVSAPGAGPSAATDRTVIVPTDQARALVAYLLSLNTEVALFERPLSAAPASATNNLVPPRPEGGGTNASAASTNLANP